VKFITYSLILLLIVSCSECDYGYFDQKYEGYFYETKWEHDFRMDGTYSSLSYGHLGVEGIFDSGYYSLIKNTIQLYSDVDDLESRPYRKFFVIEDSKIIDMNGNIFYDRIPSYEEFDFEYEDCFKKELKILIDNSKGVEYLDSQLNSEYDWGFDTVYFGMHLVERYHNDIFKVFGYKYYDHNIKMEIVANKTKRFVSLKDNKVYQMSTKGLELDSKFNDSCR